MALSCYFSKLGQEKGHEDGGVSTIRLNTFGWICRSIDAMFNGKVALEMASFLTFLNLSIAALAEGGSGMSSFFTDERLSERCCLQKHSLADCLHPL